MKRFLLYAAVGAIAILTAAITGSGAYGGSSSASASAQGGPIKIGVLTSLTGPFAPWGTQTRAGMALAVNEINRSGGVKGQGNGRKLNLVVADDQSGAAAIDGFRRLTQQENVVSVGGLIGSNVAGPTAPLAEQAKVPMFLVKAGANNILTTSSRYTFRTCLPAGAEVATAVLQFAQQRGLTNVGAIIADYAWGQSVKASMEEEFKAAPNINLDVQVAPLTTTNFIPYLRGLAGSSLIVAMGHPPGSGPILAQAQQLGIKAPVLGAFSPYQLTANAAGSAAYGRWFDFKCAAQGSKAYRALAKRFLKTFPQLNFFEDDAMAGYAYVKVVAQAIQNVGVNPQRIATYVRTHTFNIAGYAFPLKWTQWGELDGPRIALTVLTKGPPPENGLNEGGTWWPKVLFKSKPLTPYRPS